MRPLTMVDGGAGGPGVVPGSRSRDLEELIAVLQADSPRHVLAGPCSEADLKPLEALMGRRLPSPYRSYLLRLGGGLFYDRHELFGTHIAMIHDIELVPNVLTVRRRLVAERGAGAVEGLLPLHRGDGRTHLIDVRLDPGPVVTLDRPETYRDLAAFLEAVVLPR